MNRPVLTLAAVALALCAGLPGAAAQTLPVPMPRAGTLRVHRAAAAATLTGVITDAVTSKPLAGVLLTIGYLTKGYQRAAQTDTHGRYTITGLAPIRGIDAYAFKPGYFYYHGYTAINAGTTTYSHTIARDLTKIVHPKILSFYANPPTGDDPARFGMRAEKGNGPFSYEMMAISPDLGRLVVLKHGPADHYDGTLSTSGIKSGMYRFYYVATQEDCYENQTFPSVRLHL